MNLKIPLGLVLIIGLIAGYVLGTESGRAHRDVVLVKLGRGEGATDAAAADEAPEAEAPAADA